MLATSIIKNKFKSNNNNKTLKTKAKKGSIRLLTCFVCNRYPASRPHTKHVFEIRYKANALSVSVCLSVCASVFLSLSLLIQVLDFQFLFRSVLPSDFPHPVHTQNTFSKFDTRRTLCLSVCLCICFSLSLSLLIQVLDFQFLFRSVLPSGQTEHVLRRVVLTLKNN